MKILITGPRGSGKDVRAALLSKYLGIKTVTCEEVLNSEGKAYVEGDFILPGYLDNIHELMNLEMIGIKFDLVISLRISKNDVIKRTLGRRKCNKCNIEYNIEGLRKPKVDGLCDECNGAIDTIKGETPEKVEERYDKYLRHTHPVIYYLAGRGAKVVTIDAMLDPNEILEVYKKSIL